jgi:hypothetical protein
MHGHVNVKFFNKPFNKFMTDSKFRTILNTVTIWFWPPFSRKIIFVTLYIRNKDYKFCCDQSNIKGTVLERQSTFLTVCQLPTEGFSLKFTSVSPHTYPTNDVN